MYAEDTDQCKELSMDVLFLFFAVTLDNSIFFMMEHIANFSGQLQIQQFRISADTTHLNEDNTTVLQAESVTF